MDTNALLRALPKVDELLKREDVAALDVAHGRTLTLEALREALDATRAGIRAGEVAEVSADAIAANAAARLAVKARRSLRRVINATGIVVHTNLGRSPLAESAVEAVAEVARGYSTLEYDVPSGERGSRHVHVEDLICRLTGAEAATEAIRIGGSLIRVSGAKTTTSCPFASRPLIWVSMDTTAPSTVG